MHLIIADLLLLFRSLSELLMVSITAGLGSLERLRSNASDKFTRQTILFS